LPIQRKLGAGELMIPCERSFASARAYCFIMPERKAGPPALARLREWLVEETRTTREGA
jgi:hypothetical protein